MFRADTAFFPPVPAPRASGHLDVGDGHAIWWEETGPADATPVLVLHGGPGGAIRPYYRRLLDPVRHRGVFFDQRGCGKSTPFASLDHNHTQALIADIERLRRARGIARWLVVGGSWGSTLALAYAEAHPDHVTALVVSGVFLARASDLCWWWEGARWVFPEVFAARDAFLPERERGDPRSAFLARILHDDPEVHGPAAQALMFAEGQTLDLWPAPPPDDPRLLDAKLVAGARLLAHFDRADYFLSENQLIRDAGRLAGVPGAVLAGRSDMCTPPRGAYELAQAWPAAKLTIVPAAGHRWNDEMLGRALVSEIGRLTPSV